MSVGSRAVAHLFETNRHCCVALKRCANLAGDACHPVSALALDYSAKAPRGLALARAASSPTSNPGDPAILLSAKGAPALPLLSSAANMATRRRFLPPTGTPAYHLLLAAVAIFILGPLGGVTAAYMNFSLGFF